MYEKRFNFNKSELKGKGLISIGDSLTADSTIGCEKTYPHLIKNKYEMASLKNYAIGGTTATYMFKGSNIEKEYTQPDKLFAIDGCRVIDKAIANNELNNVDLAFICYGNNDMFFQVPLDNTKVNDDPLSLDNVKSIKASYRYMVNRLRSINPNIKIIIINTTYSEYDKNADLIYGNTYKFSDYLKAINEVAEELDCYCYNTWDYLKPYFYSQNKNEYYKDPIHLNVKGHEILFKYLISE